MTEGHGRIGRAFCSAHFREVPVLLRDTGVGPSGAGDVPSEDPSVRAAGPSVRGATPSGPGHALDPATPPRSAQPSSAQPPATPPPSAAPRRRFIDALRAESERTFYPRDGRSAAARDGRPVDPRDGRSADPSESRPVDGGPSEPVALPPNADMIADGVEAVTCLDYGVRCTGWLCPLFALPTVPPADLLAEAMDGERRRWRRREAGRKRRPPIPTDPADPTSPETPPSHSS